MFSLLPDARSQWILTPEPKPLYYQMEGVTSFAMKGTNLYAGIKAHGRVFRSTNYGSEWAVVPSGLTSDSVYALASNGTDLFAGDYVGVCRLNSDDTSWTKTDSGLKSGYVMAFAVKGSLLFAATSRGLFFTTNNGGTWTESNLSDTDGVTSFAIIDTNLFAGTYSGRGGGVFLSTDNGANWNRVSVGMPYAQVHALAVSGGNLFAGTRDSGILLSTDNGISWKAVSSDFIGVEIDAFAVSGTNIFAAVSPGGVYLSTNNGANWSNVSTGLTDTYISTLFMSGKYIFAGGYSGAWRRPLSDFGIADVKKSLQPDINIFLSPNPTTGIITVHNVSANILQVIVSSILGESVIELTHPNAPEFTLDLSKLPPGTYFARFVMADDVVTREIVKN